MWEIPFVSHENKVRGLLICFIGIDGSGKTTLAKRFLSIMDSKGVKAKYVWGAYDVVVLRPFILRHQKIPLREKGSSGQRGESGNLEMLLRTNAFRSVYKTLVFLEYSVEIFFKITLGLILGENIVCDRYIYDTVINLTVNLGYRMKDFKISLRSFLRIGRRPDLTFFVDVPEETAYRRKKDIPSIDYLRKRRKLYSALAVELNAVRLSGLDNFHMQDYQMREALERFLN